MQIHQHKATITAASGSVGTTSLNLRGGLLRQVLITANTSTTTFAANLVNENDVTVANWGFHQGQINWFDNAIPVKGAHTLNITNASVDDTFTVLMGIEE